MKRFLRFIRRHIILFIWCLFALAALVIMGYYFFMIAISDSNKYGNRLEGIEDVKISNSKLEEISDKLSEYEEVSRVIDVRIEGKTICIDIAFNMDVKLDEAKKITSGVLEFFDEDVLGFYDLSLLITQDSLVEEDEVWSSAGSLSAGSESISWVRG